MRSLSLTLCALALAAVSTGCAAADRPMLASPTSVAPYAYQPVVLEVVSDSGTLPAFLHGDSVFVEGRSGEHYGLRISNNSGERVEAVVSVDGRDVVSGELGDFRKQRGYVIEPWSSVVIDGYRQSLDRVASFQFTELSGSYTARRGTPQHAGVIGVAVFRQKKSRREKHQPVATTRPYYESSAEPDRRPTEYADEDAGAAFPESEPAAREKSSRAPGAFAPAPAPVNEIGTAYGESRTSVVHQTEFKRHRKRKPDARLTVYYDSLAGLQAKGVLPYQHYDRPEPQPFPGPYASPPPPSWR